MACSFDIVIATRNRPDALRLSISSILRDQKQLPSKIIVVDASDDKEQVVDAISFLEEQFQYEILLIDSPRASSTFQRNLGLDKVSADISIFPDDDSIFYPCAIDEIIRIYSKDHDKQITGVCAAEALKPPPLFPLKEVYSQKKADWFRKKLGRLRYNLENSLIPDPFQTIGKNFINETPSLSWFNLENVVKVEFMTGFRMSFRTDVITRIRFDEILDAYALAEDIDASFSAYVEGILVGARNAKVYHHKYFTKRASGYNLGLWYILNRCYVVKKHSPSNTLIIKQLKRFAYYKFILYFLAVYSSFGADRLKGALFAVRNMSKLINAKDKNELELNYSRLIKDQKRYLKIS